jgi:uncharacterized protein (TIGR02453 family)
LDIKKNIEHFCAHVFWELNKFDESLQTPWEKPYFFRIYRDARFAKGKPYKSHFGILIGQGWKPAMHQKAGYYLHIEPGNCFLIWWIWRPEPQILKAFRESIDENSQDLKWVLSEKKLHKLFELRWDKVKTAPKWYKKDHKDIDLLRYKDFYLLRNFKDSEVLSEDFFKELIKLAKVVHPVNNYINSLIINKK